MSKNEALGRLVRLAEKCNEKSIVKLCDDLEGTLEIGPYGEYMLGDLASITDVADSEQRSEEPVYLDYASAS